MIGKRGMKTQAAGDLAETCDMRLLGVHPSVEPQEA